MAKILKTHASISVFRFTPTSTITLNLNLRIHFFFSITLSDTRTRARKTLVLSCLLCSVHIRDVPLPPSLASSSQHAYTTQRSSSLPYTCLSLHIYTGEIGRGSLTREFHPHSTSLLTVLRERVLRLLTPML